MSSLSGQDVFAGAIFAILIVVFSFEVFLGKKPAKRYNGKTRVEGYLEHKPYERNLTVEFTSMKKLSNSKGAAARKP